MTLPTPKRLAREYERGASYRALAAKYGSSEKTIRRHLGDLAQPRSTGPRRMPVDDAEIVRLRDQGMSWSQLGRQVGMSYTGVRKRYAIATTGERPWQH